MIAQKPRLALPLLLASCFLAGNAAAAVLYPNVAAKNIPKNADWLRQCLRVKSQAAPAKDRPRDSNLQRCDAAELYYDTRNMDDPSDADWKRVRNCAFRTNDSAVLMMLYANGSGVKSNLDLAMRYACSVESTPAEMKARLASLQRKTAGASFDQCDDAISSNMQANCVAFRERVRDRQRNDKLSTIATTWTPKEQSVFEIANKAMHDFAQHRSTYETDLSSGRALQMETMSAELELFAKDIQDFEGGKVRPYTEAEFRALDEKVKQAYDHFMATVPGEASYLGTIRKSGVEKTQHAWLAFRDAMELFASTKYPAVPASGLRALLTARRLKQLTELDNAATGQ